MFTKAIVRPPSSTFADGLTSSTLGRPGVALALAQHEAYCKALEECGLSLVRLPADEGYPDSTFVEDTAVLTPTLAILTRPGAPSRRGEVEAIASEIVRHFPATAEIAEPGTLDGGDICEAGSHFFIGISERTNEEGARQLGFLLSREGFTVSMVDIREVRSLLHLKSGIAWLGGRRLAVIRELASHAAFHGWEVATVPDGEEYAANCVAINGRLLISSGFPHFESLLKDLALRVLALDMTEFRKMDGGLSCLSLRF